MKAALGAMSQVKHGPQRPHRILDAGAICLVDDENICDFENPCLDRLYIVAQSRSLDDKRCLGCARYFNFALPRANSLDHDDGKTGSIKRTNQIRSSSRQPAEIATCR